LGDWKDIRPVKETGCWFVGGDILTGALHVFQLQLSPLTTSITLSSNKIQNGDIPVPANPGPPGKNRLKWREMFNMICQSEGLTRLSCKEGHKAFVIDMSEVE